MISQVIFFYILKTKHLDAKDALLENLPIFGICLELIEVEVTDESVEQVS